MTYTFQTDVGIWYWYAGTSRDYVKLLSNTTGKMLPNVPGEKDEDLCWDASGTDYFTLSEGSGKPLHHFIRAT